MYDLVFNDFRREHPIFSKPQLAKYVDSYCQDANVLVSTGSIQRDVEVFVRSYVQPQRKNRVPEDDFATLLIDLELLDMFEVVKGDAGARYTIERRQRSTLPWQIVLCAPERYQGSSVSFRELANDHNGPGMVFALNEDGLLNQVHGITAHCPDIVFTDDAGIRELQFRQRPDCLEVLDGYYRA